MNKVISGLVFAGLVAAAASFGALYMPGPWYEALTRPTWTPPNWLFGPVWTALYVMIAIAGWRVWNAKGFSPLLVVWAVGLVLNALWSWIMFNQHEIGWALVDIWLILASIFAFIVLAWPVDRIAAWLFVPYGLWVSFATALNFALWQLNG